MIVDDVQKDSEHPCPRAASRFELSKPPMHNHKHVLNNIVDVRWMDAETARIGPDERGGFRVDAIERILERR